MSRNHKYYRRVWEKLNGKEIPLGFHIHHLDNDKTNNAIDNLICISPKEHFDIHRISFEKYGDKRDYFAMTYLQRYLDEKQDFSKYKRPPITEAHRQAISKANKGKYPSFKGFNHTEDAKKNMSINRSGSKNWKSVGCKDSETGIEYESLSGMAIATGLIRKTKPFEARCIR